MQDFVKYEMEFIFHVSPHLLYQYISTPSGLSEWFADNVNSRGEVFTFIWGDVAEKAKLVRKKSEELVRFRWQQYPQETFFEMKIEVDELTQDVSLFVTDFAPSTEVEDAKLLWNNQIEDLKHVLGSF